MSDVANVDIMLRSYSRDNEGKDQNENELNLDSEFSRSQQSSNLVGKAFRSFINTNGTENSEMTIETTRMIREEITNPVSRRLNEMKDSLNFQI